MQKRLIIIGVLIVVMLPFFIFSQNKIGFEINGHLDGLNNGDVVKLGNRFADWHTPIWTDSCVILNGNFCLKGGEVIEGPREYEIAFFKGKDGVSLNETLTGNYYESWLPLFVENGQKLSISGNRTLWGEIKVLGSRSNDAFVWSNALVRYADSCRSYIKRNIRKIGDSVGFDRILIGRQLYLKENLDKYLDSATKNTASSNWVGIPYLIVSLHDYFAGYHGYFQKELYDRLPVSVQNSYWGKKAQKYARLSIGQLLADFSLPTPGGVTINLRDFVKKNKITLIHFWATNSVERIAYQKELAVMYDKFHKKGLDVLAVSADTDKEEWQAMVQAKKYPWVNVIAEPNGWADGSLVNDIYGEGGHSIPNTTNVLLNSKGEILAWDVDGLELLYYLEKYIN